MMTVEVDFVKTLNRQVIREVEDSRSEGFERLYIIIYRVDLNSILNLSYLLG